MCTAWMLLIGFIHHWFSKGLFICSKFCQGKIFFIRANQSHRLGQNFFLSLSCTVVPLIEKCFNDISSSSWKKSVRHKWAVEKLLSLNENRRNIFQQLLLYVPILQVWKTENTDYWEYKLGTNRRYFFILSPYISYSFQTVRKFRVKSDEQYKHPDIWLTSSVQSSAVSFVNFFGISCIFFEIRFLQRTRKNRN